MAATRVILIEPETLLRNLLAQHLTQRIGFELIAEISEETNALAKIAILKPDLIVLEPRLSHADGLQLARDILLQAPASRVAVLTGLTDVPVIRSLLQAGVHGFIEKTQSLNEVMNALAKVAEQGRFYSPRALDIFSQLACQRQNGPPSQLSDREREILVRLARGLTTREIARALSISEFTVKTHRQNIYIKLNVNKITALTRFAMEQGWICEPGIQASAPPVLSLKGIP